MINNKTYNLGLPLPHPGNELKDDVIRLRESFLMIDEAIKSLQDLMFSDDIDLDTLKEVVQVLKKSQDDIVTFSDVMALKANKKETQDEFMRLREEMLRKADLSKLSDGLAYINDLIFNLKEELFGKIHDHEVALKINGKYVNYLKVI
ncbi:hypothetical protein [Pseudoduganella violacea]|uniref:Uncharacterized protein n=1 Tax=Pseudoduganella violacea TaxID=1715466 RepID=A0A7W5B907_9BURK|nr:hypothetical protein [Pseudoduganella violacea]MBB3118623.1 hypothetical protein [Pseudoduganella violacea]